MLVQWATRPPLWPQCSAPETPTATSGHEAKPLFFHPRRTARSLVEASFEEGGRSLLDAMIPTTTLSGREPVGIYFEVYGVAEDEPLELVFSARPVPGPPSLLGRVARALGLSSEPPPVRVEWLEEVRTPTPNLMPRYVAVDLSGFQEGEHRLVVEVTRHGGASASASRTIRIRQGGP
jgi:hypothetical protein